MGQKHCPKCKQIMSLNETDSAVWTDEAIPQEWVCDCGYRAPGPALTGEQAERRWARWCEDMNESEVAV